MKKQHHYSSEDKIIEKIDDARNRADQLNTKAENSEASATECIRQATALFDEWEGKTGKVAQKKIADAHRLKQSFFELRDNAIKCRKKAKQIEEFKLPKFGEVLSESNRWLFDGCSMAVQTLSSPLGLSTT